MSIRFNTLKMEGFQGQEQYKVFKLDQPGLNIITGPNGIGKSTIFNALAWVLYGKPLKEKATIATWEHKRSEDYSGTMVTISLIIKGHKFKVTRCKDYKSQVRGTVGKSRLIFEKDGDIYPTNLKDKRDIQRSITETLGMSYELFINTVIFPQRVTRFIEEPGSVKKQILEESFNLNWLTQMATLAKEKRNSYDQVLVSHRKTVKEVEDSLQSIQDMLDEIDKSREEFDEEQEATILELEGKINTQTNLSNKSVIGNRVRLDAIARLIMDDEKNPQYLNKSTTEDRLQVLLPKRDRAKRLRDEASKAYEALSKSHTCITCGQDLKKKDWAKHRRGHKQDMDTQQEIYDTQVKEVNPLLESLQSSKKIEADLRRLRTEQRPLQKAWDESELERLSVERAQGQIKELKDQLKREEDREFKDLSQPLRIKRGTIKLKLEKALKTQKKTQRSRDLYHWAVTDPLGSAGIKAFLFHNLLKSLNKQIAYYEKFTGMGVELEINMDSRRKDIDTIITKDGYPVSYHDLSGGESQLTNTVMALGQGDVLTQDNPTNLSVFDELLEGLDPTNIEIVGQLLRDKAGGGRSIFVITHDRLFNPTNANRIEMRKDD